MLRAAQIACFSLLLLTTGIAQAQSRPSLFGGGGLRGGAGGKLGAEAVLVEGTQPGVVSLQIKVTIPPGSNTYSQDPTFAKPTKLLVTTPAGWGELDADFFPDHPPKRELDENFGKEVEKYVGEVVFLRRYKLPAGSSAASAQIEGEVDLLVCDTACVPRKLPFSAKLSRTSLVAQDVAFPSSVNSPVGNPASEAVRIPPPVAPIASAPVHDPANVIVKELTPLRAGKPDPVKLQFELSPRHAQPGQAVTLTVTMTLQDTWNTYSLVKATGQLPHPTQIDLELKNLIATSDLMETPKPEIHVTQIGEKLETANVLAHEVRWTKNFTPKGPGGYGVTGAITYMICERNKQCLAPNLVAFTLESPEIGLGVPAVAAIEQPDAAVPAVAGLSSQELAKLFPVAAGESGGMTFVSALWGAFFAGLIMNVMPCVLPVLSIKILGFAQQAGEKRGRIIGLNLAYTLGVVAVFGVLAISAIAIKEALARGEQAASVNAVLLREEVLMTMGGVFFVMGLSLMGVFELPVPGIIPSSAHHQEGYLGAFTTGIIATVLGTPCIAPFIAPVFTWTVLQSVPIIFLTFSMMALGMAAPYLVTSVFPSLVNWLPKPGMWMVRFKQFTGFIMLGTVLFLMASIDLAHLIPYLIILLGLGLAAWMAGTYAPPSLSYIRQFGGWVFAILCAAPVAWFGIHELQGSAPVGVWGVAAAGTSQNHAPAPGALPWKSFSEDYVVGLRREGKPMIIDFTANWCVICKANERIALNTAATSEFVEKNGFIPVVADFTTENPQMLKWLRHFGQESVPLTIIVPPGRDSRVLVLAGPYFQGGLLTKLNEAVGTAAEPATASVPQPRQEAARKADLFGDSL